MNYKVETIDNFRKEAKKLARKYPSLKHELAELGAKLSLDPTTGTPLGKECYKIRIAIQSKGKGKSGGARIITHFFIKAKTIYLLSIYDKSDKENISDKEISELLQSIK